MTVQLSEYGTQRRGHHSLVGQRELHLPRIIELMPYPVGYRGVIVDHLPEDIARQEIIEHDARKRVCVPVLVRVRVRQHHHVRLTECECGGTRHGTPPVERRFRSILHGEA